jgi:putative phosphoribosyl transferase
MGKLRILSTSGMPFETRQQAGRLLAAELGDYQGVGAVVLGIPRGGVVVANELAHALEADLDIVLAHKIGAPGNSELAIGAMGESGEAFLDDRLVSRLGVSLDYVNFQKKEVMEEVARRRNLYRSARLKVPLADRTVIVTDDGVATGATMRAALWAVRREEPAKLIAALPVGAPDTVGRIAELADETVCLRTPSYFDAVGRFYLIFDQTQDAELLTLLRREGERVAAR